jgi:hypothetical protein
MRKKILAACTIILSAWLIAPACKTSKDPSSAERGKETACASATVSYKADIQPVIEKNCLRCHGMASKKGDFSTYEGLKVVAANGELKEHVLILKNMPPKNPLPETDQQKIRCWLLDGFQDN